MTPHRDNLDPAAPRRLRAVVYTRISDDPEGREVGVDRQLIDGRALCARRGMDVVGEFCDNDISASEFSDEPRPDYDAALAMIREDKADVLVAYSSQRITRRPDQWEELIKLHRATGMTIATVVTGDIDLSTAAGRRITRINYAIGAGEPDEIRERILRANKHLVEVLGEPSNGVKYGWRRGMARQVEVNPEEANVVQEIARRVASGESMNSVKKDLNARCVPTPHMAEIARKARAGELTRGKKPTRRGIPHPVVEEIGSRVVAGEGLTSIVADMYRRGEKIPEWSHASLRSLVLRPLNAGRIAYGGRLVPSTFPRILDEETYQAVVTILGDESRAPRRPEGMRHREIKHFLSGVTFCGKPAQEGVRVLEDGTRVCGARMRVRTDSPTRRAKTPERQLVKQTTYQSYSCPRCNGTSCRTFQAEAAVERAVLTLLTRPDAPAMLSGDPAEVAAQQARIEGLAERRRRTARAYADGAYEDEEYADLLAGIDAEIADARERKRQAGPRHELARWLDGEAEATWATSDPGERRDLVAALMTVVILPGGRGRKGFDPDQRLSIQWK